METILKWAGNMAFSGISASGHEITMDAAEAIGGQNTGARPMELLLFATAGCTGIDIISILKKMRLEPTNFQMEVKGERAETEPKRFTKMHIHYSLEGDLPEGKVARAIQLSKDKYCSVAHTLNTEITVSFSINGVKSANEI